MGKCKAIVARLLVVSATTKVSEACWNAQTVGNRSLSKRIPLPGRYFPDLGYSL